MKKSSVNALQTPLVFFIVLLISTSASSITFSVQQHTNISVFEKQGLPTTSDQKITDILSMIDENLILDYLQTIVGYGPRMTGSYGCEKAAQYIHKLFTDSGLTTRYQTWTSWGTRYYHYLYTSQNVEGILPGTDSQDDSCIIFNAHYDSIARGPGANDDGSGTVAVMAAAYALSHFNFKRTVKFVAFNALGFSISVPFI
jgi:acetylornithine deacetylase/succinyl-diaminopimelate desuccinylase-like protein